MAEIWRDIPGYEGSYQVSNLGQVRSLDRTVEQVSPRGTMMRRKLRGQLLKACRCSNGYLQVSLGYESLFRIHRLVALAFVDGDTGLQVNHKNGNRADNRAENLEWVTCSDNHLHSYRELTRKKHGLTRPVVLNKEGQEMQFESMLDAAKHLGLVPGSVASAAARDHKCRGWEVQYA